MEKWRFIPLQIKNGYWNMALDEAILKSVIDRKSYYTIRFYKWSPSTVSIGLNQSLSAEVNLNIVKENCFNIVRRITGGALFFMMNLGKLLTQSYVPLNF